MSSGPPPASDPRPLVIVGAGGHGREMLDIVDARGRRREFAGFVDDADLTVVALERLAARSAEVAGGVEWLVRAGLDYVVGIGSSAARRDIVRRLAGAAGRPVTLVHPTASVGSVPRLGEGVVIGAHATITTNVVLGHHTHVNVGCAVQHDSQLGDFVTVSPGVFINGDVVIGSDVFLGTGAIVTRGTTIGDGATIGAGAVVLGDVAPGDLVLGVPGRARAT